MDYATDSTERFVSLQDFTRGHKMHRNQGADLRARGSMNRGRGVSGLVSPTNDHRLARRALM